MNQSPAIFGGSGAIIKSDLGRCDLTALKGEPEEVVEKYLTSLPGVSEKVAKCVMMYTMSARVLPVDVHVHRVATRLGWTTRKRADQCHQDIGVLGASEMAIRLSCRVRPSWSGDTDPMNPSAKAVASRVPASTSQIQKQKRASSRPTGVDLFSGVGGMSLGFEQAGFDVIAAADVEEIHTQTYTKNFPKCKTWCTDLSSATGKQFREETGIGDKQIDVVFAGPPCQGFSVMGKAPPKYLRNLLLYDLARLVEELSPSDFVVENVEGIVMGDVKEILNEFIQRVARAGYSVVKPIQVLDAAEFGVPLVGVGDCSFWVT